MESRSGDRGGISWARPEGHGVTVGLEAASSHPPVVDAPFKESEWCGYPPGDVMHSPTAGVSDSPSNGVGALRRRLAKRVRKRDLD